MKIQNRKQSGFTLLELLVVVSILAIIAGAVISAISGQEETAGQGVALHTMGALENATRQQVVLNDGLPSGLDSLLCADTIGETQTTNLNGSAALMGSVDGNAGGLAPGLFAKLTAVNIPTEGALAISDAGVTSLRYVETEACDETDGNTVSTDDDAYSEVLANRLFWDETQEGFGLNATVDTGAVLPLAVLNDPADVGAEETDIIAVLGVGNFTEMSEGQNKIISRGPVDGNVEGEGQYYSHFSLAIKIGEVDPGEDPADQTTINTSSEFEGDEIEIVAVLDSDGDNFDDEIAEFNGLEDE